MVARRSGGQPKTAANAAAVVNRPSREMSEDALSGVHVTELGAVAQFDLAGAGEAEDPLALQL
jgi:hypothetical protein